MKLGGGATTPTQTPIFKWEGHSTLEMTGYSDSNSKLPLRLELFLQKRGHSVKRLKKRNQTVRIRHILASFPGKKGVIQWEIFEIEWVEKRFGWEHQSKLDKGMWPVATHHCHHFFKCPPPPGQSAPHWSFAWAISIPFATFHYPFYTAFFCQLNNRLIRLNKETILKQQVFYTDL